MDALARLRPKPMNIFIYSENGGGVVRRIPDDENHAVPAENHLWQ